MGLRSKYRVPDCGLICDLLWSGLDRDIRGWSENDRDVSFTFGHNVVSQVLQKHEMDTICRSCQIVEDGYEFFWNRQLVTLFSAADYCGRFNNKGVVMHLDKDLLCQFPCRLIYAIAISLNIDFFH